MNGTKYHLRLRAVAEHLTDPDDTQPGSWVNASGTPNAGIVVEPTSLTVPVGARKCYLLRPVTNPTHGLTYTATPAATTTATVGAANLGNQRSNAIAESWKVGFAYCVKGVAVGTTTIAHTVASDDTNFDGITIADVSVTVTAADTTPTVRFLHSEMRAVEGSTSPEPQNFHGLELREITVKLDIAPAPSSTGKIMWWIPHPDCGNVTGMNCPAGYSGDATYAGDYVPTGLMGRQVWYTSGSNDMQFKFLIVSDNEDEDDEWVRLYMLRKYFDPLRGIVPNSNVRVGGSGLVGANIRIIDDDGSSGGSMDSGGTEGDLGVFTREQNDYAELITKIREWRNDARYVSDKAHTDCWDRVLLAFGETVADATLTPMTADEAQGYADRGWTRWVEVAEALRDIESG